MIEWLQHIEFAKPVFFGLFLFLPVLIWQYNASRQMQATLKVSSAQAYTTRSWKNRLRHLPFLLRLLAVAALILALARPQVRQEEKRLQGEGIDIVLCMDVSGSMRSRD